jgi:peptidoglycan hydrolase CwlO-like protein
MLMAQLAAMENQVVTIETRFLRRERELEALVEETRASNKVERARLAALHAQDLHEKDEQLLRFKSELEVLVAALKAHSLGQQQEAHRMLEHAAASTMQLGGGDYDFGDEDGMSLNMSQQRSVAMAS